MFEFSSQGGAAKEQRDFSVFLCFLCVIITLNNNGSIINQMSWPAEISFAQPGIDEHAKLNFAYITTNICPDGAEIDEIGCTDCSCVERNPLGPLMFEFSSSKAGRQKEQRLFPLIHGILDHASTTIFVCGPHCSSCKGTCSNSLNASRLQHPLELRAAAAAAGGRDGKGIGVFSCSFISLGSFVCEYVGECVSGVEATKRLKKYDGDAENVARGRGHALLMVREVLPSRSAAVRSYIDATVKGNVARFINHR